MRLSNGGLYPSSPAAMRCQASRSESSPTSRGNIVHGGPRSGVRVAFLRGRRLTRAPADEREGVLAAAHLAARSGSKGRSTSSAVATCAAAWDAKPSRIQRSAASVAGSQRCATWCRTVKAGSV